MNDNAERGTGPEPGLSIVLPCYNEADSLPLLLTRFRETLAGRTDVEVVLVDNGSADDTPRVLREALADPAHAFARTVRVPVNRGYGYGIMEGVRAARGAVIAWTHADLQTDPKDVLDAYAVFRDRPDDRVLLKGRRIHRPPLDAFFTFGMSLISSWALGARLFDVNAQPKMFALSFLKELANPPDDFSLDLYVLYRARRLGYAVLEQPVSFAKRRHGEAKGGGTLKGKWKLIRRTWAYIFKLKERERHGHLHSSH